MPGFRQPFMPIDNDDAEDCALPDALDVDRITDTNIRSTFAGEGAAAQVADLYDPEFELIRQAYPNRPRPYGYF